MHVQPASTTRFTLVALCAIALLAGGCVLQSDGAFQTLVLFFELDQEIPEGEPFLVHTAVYPNRVELRKQFVRISGRIEPSPDAFAEQAELNGGAAAETMATRVMVEVLGEEMPTDSDTGDGMQDPKQDHKFKNKITIEGDGSFEATKKFKKNIGADVVQTITVEGLNGMLPAGATIALCVDIAEKKKDFTAENSCATPLDDSPGAATHTVQVLDHRFEPQQLTIQPGDTVEWELFGLDTTHTVTAMSGAFDSGFVFTEQGATFQRTFPQSEDGETFEYFCQTHRTCCQMQGSILVGADASPPMDGY